MNLQLNRPNKYICICMYVHLLNRTKIDFIHHSSNLNPTIHSHIFNNLPIKPTRPNTIYMPIQLIIGQMQLQPTNHSIWSAIAIHSLIYILFWLAETHWSYQQKYKTQLDKFSPEF